MRWPRGPDGAEEHYPGTRGRIWRSTTRQRRKQRRQERHRTRTLDAGTPSLTDEARASFRARDSHKPIKATSSAGRATHPPNNERGGVFSRTPKNQKPNKSNVISRANPRVRGFTAIAVICQTNSKNTGRKSSGLAVTRSEERRVGKE